MGGVKCQPFLKHSNHWKRALKMIFKGSGCSVTNFCNEGKVMLLLSMVRYQVLLCFRHTRYRRYCYEQAM